MAQGRDLNLAEKISNISSNTNQIENSGQLLHLCVCMCVCAEEHNTILTPRRVERPFC